MTYLRAFSMVVVLTTVAVVMGALAVFTASAPPARGDPSVTEGAGGGSGTGGGVDPPGGITDAPPPEVPNTDGSWTATVGGTEFAGLTQADVGRVLWRGDRSSGFRVNEFGFVEVATVCASLPDIRLGTRSGTRSHSSGSFAVMIDLQNCTVSVAPGDQLVTSDRTPNKRRYAALAVDSDQPLPPSSAVPIVWRSPETAPVIRPDSWHDCPRLEGASSRGSRIRGFVQGLGGRTEHLTEVLTERCYSLADFSVTHRYHDCDTDTPWGFNLFVTWHQDDCFGRSEPRPNFAREETRGTFHADHFERGPVWHHTIVTVLSGYFHEDFPTCFMTPDISDDIHLWGPFTGVFECSFSSDDFGPANH